MSKQSEGASQEAPDSPVVDEYTPAVEQAPAEEAPPTTIEEPSRQTVRSFVPPQRDPAEFTEPGLEQGLYPGDPNLYQDPEKSERSY